MKHLRFIGVAAAAICASVLAGQARPDTASGTPVARGDSAALPPDTAHKILINREVFAYDAGGRRDPFLSLMNTSELRPLVTDLKLVAVAYDPDGGNSVAVLRDLTSKEQYRVRVGQTIGRLKVAAIHEKDIVFTIEEFGYSRQETLTMGDTTKAGTPQ